MVEATRTIDLFQEFGYSWLIRLCTCVMYIPTLNSTSTNPIKIKTQYRLYFYKN